MVSRKIVVSILYMIITLIYVIITISVILSLGVKDFVPIIPGSTRTDIFVLFICVPILICFPLLFLRLITVINFKVMKRFQKNYEFYYIDLTEQTFESKNIIARAFLPVFLALAISQLLNSIQYFYGIFGIDPISSIIMLSLILAPLTSFLLLPVWTFKDSGIIRVRKRSKLRFPPEISYFGRIQHQSYRGFAGITTPILYFLTMYIEMRTSLGINPTTLVIFLYPLFLIGFYMPLMILYEKRIPRLSEKIRKSLKLKMLNLETIERNLLSFTNNSL
ncbi:MAG: hypothetical protein ACTSQJ_06735 [Promethearchaeota archaeon]